MLASYLFYTQCATLSSFFANRRINWFRQVVLCDAFLFYFP